MRTEMDVMHMDERQRLHWLEANRATLMVVGVVWLAMIGFELSRGETPGFLIVMLPVFAGLRLGFYYFFARSGAVPWPLHAVLIALLGVGHFGALTVAMVGESISDGFLWFVPPEPSHVAWSVAVKVLGFPLLLLLDANDPFTTFLSKSVAILNSLIWAGGVYLLFRWARRLAGRA